MFILIMLAFIIIVLIIIDHYFLSMNSLKKNNELLNYWILSRWKIKNKVNIAKEVAQPYSTCLENVRPWVQYRVTTTKRKKERIKKKKRKQYKEYILSYNKEKMKVLLMSEKKAIFQSIPPFLCPIYSAV